MRLYAVRFIEDKQAVGFYWASDVHDLICDIDLITEPERCEYQIIEEPASIVWDGLAPPLGVSQPDDDNTDGDNYVDRLRKTADFDGAFNTFIYGEAEDLWEPLAPIARGVPLRYLPISKSNRPKRKRAPPVTSLAAAARPSLPPADTIYFIACGEYIKIGITAGTAERRLKALATAHHQHLTLLATIENAPGELEIALHERFAAHRVRGEWFKLSPELAEFIERIKTGTWKDEL